MRKIKYDIVDKLIEVRTIILSVAGVAFLHIIGFFEYITADVYFNYYGLDVNLYKYKDYGFMYSFILFLIYILLLVSAFICMYDCVKTVGWKKRITNFIACFCLNSLFLGIFDIVDKGWSFAIVSVCLLLLEVSASLYFTCPKKRNTSFVATSFMKSFSIILFVLIIFYTNYLTHKIRNGKDYSFIDDNTVIVYANSDYYLTLDCEIEKDKLIIYKGSQTKIDNANVHTESRNFKKVEVKIRKEKINEENNKQTLATNCS